MLREAYKKGFLTAFSKHAGLTATALQRAQNFLAKREAKELLGLTPPSPEKKTVEPEGAVKK